MRYTELLEGREAPLYHLMDFAKSQHVFETDAMPARWKHDIPGLGVRMGNSFTRSNRLVWGRVVRLTIDQRALSARYKIIPLDGEMAFRNTNGYGPLRDRVYNALHGKNPVWAEEFVVGDIKDVHRYVTEVRLMKPMMYYNDREHFTPMRAIELQEAAEAYCAKYSIGLNIHWTYREFIEEARKRWAEDEAEEMELDAEVDK